MYGIDHSRKTQLSGCLFAWLPRAGPRDAVYLVYVFGGHGCCSVVKRFAVTLPPPADLVDGGASGSQSGLISFSSLSALSFAKTAPKAVLLVYKDESGFGGAESVKQVRSRSNRLLDFFVCLFLCACVHAGVCHHQLAPMRF